MWTLRVRKEEDGMSERTTFCLAAVASCVLVIVDVIALLVSIE